MCRRSADAIAKRVERYHVAFSRPMTTDKQRKTRDFWGGSLVYSLVGLGLGGPDWLAGERQPRPCFVLRGVRTIGRQGGGAGAKKIACMVCCIATS